VVNVRYRLKGCSLKDIEKIIEVVKDWIDNQKTGSIQINFFKGHIGNLNLNNSIKLDTTKPKEVKNEKRQ